MNTLLILCLVDLVMLSKTVSGRLHWMDDDNGNRPPGENYTYANDVGSGPVVGRGTPSGETGIVVGKVSNPNSLNAVYNNIVHNFQTTFEVLIYDDEPGFVLWWVTPLNNELPQAAVNAGQGIGGLPFYASRIWNIRVSEYTPSNYEEGGTYAEYQDGGAQSSPEWDILVLKCLSTIVTAMYLDNGVVDREDTTDVNPFMPLTDGLNDTCIGVTDGAMNHLQAIFRFNATFTNTLNMEIVLRGPGSCESPEWTWFVETECITGGFYECFSTGQRQISPDTRSCLISCVCATPCNYFYIKNNVVPWLDQTNREICEVNLVYTLVENNRQYDIVV